MRMVLYVIILALLYLAPLKKVDIAKLLPIEAVAVYMEQGEVVLETDTEHMGRGSDVSKALENLKADTPAVVYLDTAEYLIISEDALAELDALKTYLKPNVRVCVADVCGRVKDTAKYLEVHGNLPKIKNWKNKKYLEK